MRKLVLAVALLLPAPAAADWPYVHSHRGGSIRGGVATFAEESMPAFRSAWHDEHTVLELDVKLSKDRVPVVIHDATLDRTTVCTGDVDAYTWDELRTKCPSDVLGIGSITKPAVPPVRMTKLSELLRYARRAGAYLNLEIKNLPGDDDFDSSPAFATTVCDAILRSRFPVDHLIVQSFWPPNLDVAAQDIPGVQTSYLSLAPGAANAAFAAARGYAWWSPSGAPTAADVQAAHALGVKVVPWTLDTPADVRAAHDAGADAIITNDPVMARQALGGSGK